MRSFIITTTLISAAVLTSACNTMEGAGQDLQTGGKKLERSANENKGSDSRSY